MLETLAEVDETLMEKYFDDPSTITEDEVRAAIRKGTLAMQFNPMICGSSFKNKGVQTLLDAVCAYLPRPRTRVPSKAMPRRQGSGGDPRAQKRSSHVCPRFQDRH